MLKYNFYTEDDYCYCDLTYNDLTFTGTAKCHSDDYDMKSERTGYFIAETRANIDKLRWVRDYEIIPMLKSYKHLYDCIIHAPKGNKDSYEAQCIYRKIKLLEIDLKDLREAIKEERDYLREYIAEKEKIYQRIRKGKTN
jgi:hypothetical protein